MFSNKKAANLPKGPAWESPDVDDDAYADGRIANRATRRLAELKADSSRPFFLAVGFARPHLPFSVPKKYWDKYDPLDFPLPAYEKAPEGAPAYAVKRDTEIDQYLPIPHSSEIDPFPDDLKRRLIHGYYAGVSYVDEQIGKVLKTLEDLKLDESTIVVLWGDHGYHLGEMGIWTKHVNYELANRIPLVLVAPSVTKPGTSTQQLAETVDLFPTLAELAGFQRPVTTQPLDGESLVKVLRSPGDRVRDHAYHCFPRGGKMGRAIRTEHYRLIEWKQPGTNADDAEYELYDYENGNVEMKNLAAEKRELLDQMKTILNRHPEAASERKPGGGIR